MPALVRTSIRGKIVWLGQVRDRAKTARSLPVNKMTVTFEGAVGEAHSGLTRGSCLRVTDLYAEGTEIRNARQFSIVSQEEMNEVATQMGLPSFSPEWCGASIVIAGIPDFSHIPPSSRLQSENGTTLTVDMENQPCNIPGRVINEDAPGVGRQFKAAAKDKRGVTAWVEREGALEVGDTLTLHVPEQRGWTPHLAPQSSVVHG